jgi:Pin2-interacting protein X1
MSKLGWDPSKGLGVAGDGRTSHIRVSQKLDMLGVGAANSKDPNGIAWKQNKDFEALLRRLNEDAEKKDGMILEGIDVEGSEGALEVVDEGREKHDNKRKRKDGDGASGTNKKKRKKEKDVDDSSVKKHKSKKSDAAPSRRSIVEESSSATVTTPIKIAAPRPMAYVHIF